jgi:hypothetical protein
VQACAPTLMTQSIVVSRILQVRSKLVLDGNAGAFFKCVGELAVHAGDLLHARELFVEAVPLFREVPPSLKLLVAACNSILVAHL